MLIKDRLRELRKAKNMSQETVALELAISRSTYAKWETGIRVPQKFYLEQLATLYGISLYEIIGVDDAKELVIDTSNKLNKTILGMILGLASLFIIAISISYFFKIYGTYCVDIIGLLDDNGYIYITYSLVDMSRNPYPLTSLIINAVFIISAIITFLSYNHKPYKIIRNISILCFILAIIFIVIAFLSGRFMLPLWLGKYLVFEV